MEEHRKSKRKVKNCYKQKKKEEDSPSYENEHSLYQKEISLKIEEFKLARSNWVASKKEEEIMKTNSKEGLNESGAYRGRFSSLKKIGLSTIRLREHYQTVKPLRYFTLKPKVSDTQASKSREEKHWDQPLIEQDSFEEDTMLREKKQQIWDEKETEIKELVDEALGGKVTEKEKKKKKRKGPSKKALENLRASKHADRVLETCKCNDGKEVTVVIKGFCLCDKGNLKTFKLNKINDDIKKLEKFKPGLEKEEIGPHLVDSMEFHKKQIERKSAIIKEEEEEEEKEEKQQDGMQRSKSAKSVSFGPPNISRGIDNERKSEKNEEKRDQEEVGGKERYEKEQKKTEEEEKQEKMRKEQEERRQERVEEKTSKEQEDMRKKREEEEKQLEEVRKEQEERRQERVEEKKEGEEKRSKEQEDMRKKREEEEKQLEEVRKEQEERRQERVEEKTSKEQEDMRKKREEEEKQLEEVRKEQEERRQERVEEKKEGEEKRSKEQEDMRKRREEEEKQLEEVRKEQEERRQERVEEKKEGEEKRSKEQEDMRKKREEEEKHLEEMRKEQEERRKENEEKMVQQERSGEKNEAESKKREEKNEKLQNSTDDVASVITIFQNRSPNKSSMALTQEQFEKMKKISE